MKYLLLLVLVPIWIVYIKAARKSKNNTDRTHRNVKGNVGDWFE